MNEFFVTLNQLSEISNINVGTLRVYLSRYTFSKFYIKKRFGRTLKRGCILNDEFIEKFCYFLQDKRNRKSIDLIKKYWTNIKRDFQMPIEERNDLIVPNRELDKKILILENENQELKRLLTLTNGQYETLLKRYNQLLKNNKVLEKACKNILQICEEQADNIAVVEMQDRVKELING